MTDLPHSLERIVVIRAPRETVFTFFTASAKWAAWWGAGSEVDPRPGGKMLIKYPGGVEASGEVLEVDAPRRFVFTMGYATNPKLPPGSSRVSIALEPHPDGTRLTLTHALPDAAVRDEHRQGWRYQLALFSNVVANEVASDATATVDGWFAAWADPDVARRTTTLQRVATTDVRFRDRYSHVDGIDDLVPHITAAQHFMPGMAAVRSGDVRHCQGTVLADWIVKGPDGASKARGTNVFLLDANGRIASATGLWG